MNTKIPVYAEPSEYVVKLWWQLADRPGVYGIAEWQKVYECWICGKRNTHWYMYCEDCAHQAEHDMDDWRHE